MALYVKTTDMTGDHKPLVEFDASFIATFDHASGEKTVGITLPNNRAVILSTVELCEIAMMVVEQGILRITQSRY